MKTASATVTAWLFGVSVGMACAPAAQATLFAFGYAFNPLNVTVVAAIVGLAVTAACSNR